ncbi:hypothetical protein [Moraxella lacunata]|uniref:hypothetical protein n=1 Tax=Moraxella lacunata TaxID=477 RepID=UPI0038573D7E
MRDTHLTANGCILKLSDDILVRDTHLTHCDLGYLFCFLFCWVFASLNPTYELLNMNGTTRVFADLFLLGLSGGIYIVPLYTFMQAYAPISHRSRIVGANNIFNAIFMVGSAIFSIIILTVLTLSIPQLFLITGVINAVFGIFLYIKLTRYKDSMAMAEDGGMI